MRISAPANLLLLGEFAVLDPGGLGLAVAPERRVEVTVRPGAGLVVTGRWGGPEPLRWEEGSPPGGPQTALLEAVAESVRERLPGRRLPEAAIEVDSTAFFVGGRKAGYGSSAAVAAALSWALLAAAGGEAPAAALDVALAAHRRAQGGQGSGYDVFASFYGGTGLFTGGQNPAWRRLDLPWLEPLQLWRGSRSVSTPNAIGRYREWQERQPGEAARFLEESNRNCAGFVAAASRSEAFAFFARSRELGLRLGQAIGVPAEITPPPGVPASRCKALGAGNELALVFPEALPVEGLEPLRVAATGIVWER